MVKTTIIISPRERFNTLLASLRSLFETIAEDVPVIVVDGGGAKTGLSATRSLTPDSCL